MDIKNEIKRLIEELDSYINDCPESKFKGDIEQSKNQKKILMQTLNQLHNI
jgi:hypothetical protein